MEIVLKYWLLDHLAYKVVQVEPAQGKLTPSASQPGKQFIESKVGVNDLAEHLETLISRAYTAGLRDGVNQTNPNTQEHPQKPVKSAETSENRGKSCEDGESGVNPPPFDACSYGVLQDTNVGKVEGVRAASVLQRVDVLTEVIDNSIESAKSMLGEESETKWNEGYSSALAFRIDLLKRLRDMVEGIRADLTDDTEEQDLFLDISQLPEHIQLVIAKYDTGDNLSYAQCKAFKAQLEQHGFTFSYGLDAEPYNLRKLVK